MKSERVNNRDFQSIYLPEQLIEAARVGAVVDEYLYIFKPSDNEESIAAFFKALTIENCPEKITISITDREDCPDKDILISFAISLLECGKCKNGLTLYFNGTPIGDEGALRLASTLLNLTQIKNLTLDVHSNHITSVGTVALAQAIGRNPSAVSNLVIYGNTIGAAGIEAIASLLQQGLCGHGFQLRLRSEDFEGRNDEIANILLLALLSGNCPVRFGLCLSGIKLKHQTLLKFADAIQSGKLPDGFFLGLGGRENGKVIGGEYTLAFAAALMSGRAPSNMTLEIFDQNVTESGVKAFATAIKHNNCPKGLTLYLPFMHYLHVEHEFAEALKSGTSLVCIQLDGLGYHDLERTGLFIRHACLRNKLMHEYPAYADAIKRMCIDKGLLLADYNAHDYWKMIKINLHIEPSFPDANTLDKLPPGLISGLMDLSNFEYDMAPMKYDASRHGFFSVKGPYKYVNNIRDYAELLMNPDIPDKQKPVFKLYH